MADNEKLPPRPQRIPPHVLRRRRIIAGIILFLVLGLLVWGIWALISLFLPDDDAAMPDPEPTVSESAEPSPTESPSEDEAAGGCEPEVLALTGATDQEAYAEDELPTFTMTITQDGDELCDASVGPDEQNFVVQDAEGEFVFSTRSCQVQPQSQVVEMEPGQSESVEFQWERVGTDEDCQSVDEDLEAGEYQLVVGLGDQTADPVTFELQ